jgi:hypothetical protein
MTVVDSFSSLTERRAPREAGQLTRTELPLVALAFFIIVHIIAKLININLEVFCELLSHASQAQIFISQPAESAPHREEALLRSALALSGAQGRCHAAVMLRVPDKLPLPVNLFGRFVSSQRQKFRVPQTAFSRPFYKSNLRNQLRSHPL